MTSITQLEQIFDVPFEEQPDITALRQFHANNTFCRNEAGQVVGICACENEFKEIRIQSELLPQLEYLNLSDNKNLQNLSFDQALPKLRHLDISDSRVEELVLPIGFKSLEWLDVSRNQLSTVELCGEFPCLSYVDLSGNQLAQLHIPAAEQLKYVYAQKNKLDTFALSPHVSSLVVLDLQENQLDSLPFLITSLQKLEALYVFGNPLKAIPPENIAKGKGENSLENIRNYFLSITQDEAIANDEIKLVLLGNSTSGKSSLLRYLRKKKYDDQLSSTHGIYNKLWPLDEGNLKINVWDFGGQEFYHATHRLFLSNNAVTLILFEKDTNFQGEKPTLIKLYDQGKLVEKPLPLQHFPHSYWLDSLKYFCQEQQSSSTVLIQTKMDLEDTEIARISDQDKEKYQLAEENIFHLSVKGAYTDIRKYKRSFEAFEEDLLALLHQVKASYPISTKWLQIKEALRKQGETRVMLPYAEYVVLCEEIRPGISEPGEQEGKTVLDTLTNYLHEISVILYYPGIEALKNTVFINPQWVTTILYKVLDYSVMQKEGKFDRQHIEQIIDRDEQAGNLQADQLIALMKQFELIFPVKSTPDLFVAPQYLPKENPEAGTKSYQKILNKCQQHAFTIRYPVFMPRSVMTRLICRYGNLSEDVFWRNGIVFEKEQISVHLTCEEHHQIRVLMEILDPPIAAELFANIQEINERHPDVEVSVNGTDYVKISQLLDHPAANQAVQTVEGNWVEMENFLFLLGRKGRDTFIETIPNEHPHPNNSKRMNEINKLVGNDRLKEALEVLLQLAPVDQKDQVSLLQRELKALNSQRIIGVLSHKEENLSRNSLASRILELASSFKEENPTIAPEYGTEGSSPQTNLAPLKNNPPKAFISYAHKEDSRYFKLFAEGVKVHSDWDIFTDRDILIGEDWHERLQQEVKTCDFAIFLLSPYFFRSDYIKKHEFEQFIERNVADGFPFFSVLLADCDFQKWEAIASRQIFVAHGQDYNLAGPHRDKQISFDRLVHYNQTNGELVPNSYRNTYYKNFVQAVNKALQR